MLKKKKSPPYSVGSKAEEAAMAREFMKKKPPVAGGKKPSPVLPKPKPSTDLPKPKPEPAPSAPAPAAPKVSVPGVPPVIQGRGPLPPQDLQKEKQKKEAERRSLRVTGRGVGPYRDDGYNMYPRDPAMKDGGRVRGDGMSRVKTKGRCL